MNPTSATAFFLLLFISPAAVAGVARRLTALVQEQPLVLRYHHGLLLKGNVTVNIAWYGVFSPAQRSILVDFLRSLSPRSGLPSSSVSAWWKTTEKYNSGASRIILGKQIIIEGYPIGKNLKDANVVRLAGRFPGKNQINAVFTDKDVAVEGFCMSRCGTHGWSRSPGGAAYLWVGNPERQCPGQCAWPFHQPIYGPQTPALTPPNGDVGVDGMVISLATVLAGAVTNPSKKGFFQGPATAPLEAVSACTGIFGKNAYPGYPGELATDKVTGASYNAHGLNGRRYLIPAIWDPATASCATLQL